MPQPQPVCSRRLRPDRLLQHLALRRPILPLLAGADDGRPTQETIRLRQRPCVRPDERLRRDVHRPRPRRWHDAARHRPPGAGRQRRIHHAPDAHGPTRDRGLHGPAHGLPHGRRCGGRPRPGADRRSGARPSGRGAVHPRQVPRPLRRPRHEGVPRRRDHVHRAGQERRRHDAAGGPALPRGVETQRLDHRLAAPDHHAPDLRADHRRRDAGDQPRRRQGGGPPRQHRVQPRGARQLRDQHALPRHLGEHPGGQHRAGRPRPVRRQRLGPQRRVGPLRLRRPAAPPPPARAAQGDQRPESSRDEPGDPPGAARADRVRLRSRRPGG